jgi:hypothetical protein
MKSVYSAVRTGSLYKAVCLSSLKGYFSSLNFSDVAAGGMFEVKSKLA